MGRELLADAIGAQGRQVHLVGQAGSLRNRQRLQYDHFEARFGGRFI